MRIVVLALALVACSSPPKPTPAPTEPTQAGRADGSPCLASSECASGVCEGEGCGDDHPGTCASKSQTCTEDDSPFCSCDGKTVFGSTTCPGVRFQKRGTCEPPIDAGPLVDAAPALVPDGGSCLANEQCASGACEGQGCSDLAPGTCAPAQRACTKDLRPYCGCDGKTFRTSGTCPGRRYFATGACPTAATNRPAGAPCLKASECATGVCAGLGCTDDQPGVCAPNPRPCTGDAVQFCGCDGKTSVGPSTCPRVRYRSRGACPAP